MSEGWSPNRWANSITTMLNAVYGGTPDRFPVNVPQLAREYSAHRYPDDPITLVKGAPLPGFDGALYRAPSGKIGWGIIYNDAIRSAGRINFTLGHEFGHYLLHRLAHPDGLECGDQDMVRWDSEYAQIEQQANEFAVALLMPLDDFRSQVDPRAKPTLDDIGQCAKRYDVSLIAATLRWLQYTERRSVLVVSRDGYILWARSSGPALRTGAYFKTAGRSPIAVPLLSIAAGPGILNGGFTEHDGGVWFAEPCEEIALASDHYDFTISLLHLDDAEWRIRLDEETTEDVLDLMQRRVRRS
jgi:hypothetical protein